MFERNNENSEENDENFGREPNFHDFKKRMLFGGNFGMDGERPPFGKEPPFRDGPPPRRNAFFGERPPFREGPPPRDGRHPFRQGPPPREGPPPFGRKLPFLMTQKSFKEMKEFLLLNVFSNQPEGLTGYTLQEKYNFPRGNTQRILDDLYSRKLLTSEEKIVNGRTQKIFKISEKGLKYLEELKEKWSSSLAVMSDMAPFERYGHPFRRRKPMDRILGDLEHLKSNEEVIDYISGLRSDVRYHLNRSNKRVENLTKTKELLDKSIENVKKMSDFDLEKIQSMMEEIRDELLKARL